MDIGVNVINSSDFQTRFQDTAVGPTRLQAVMALSQKFAKILLTQTGSDIYSFALGGEHIGTGLKSFLNDLDSNTSVGSIRSQVESYIKQVADFIRKNQNNTNLPNTEKLFDAQLVEIYRDQKFEIVIKIAITNLVGETFMTLINEGQVVNFRYND